MKATVHYRKMMRFLDEDGSGLCAFITALEAWGLKTSDTSLIKRAGLESDKDAAPVSMYCN